MDIPNYEPNVTCPECGKEMLFVEEGYAPVLIKHYKNGSSIETLSGAHLDHYFECDCGCRKDATENDCEYYLNNVIE